MLVKKDFDIRSDCWGGAKDRIESLPYELIDILESYLSDDDFWGEDTPTDTQVNDFIWFDDDTYAEWLGFDDAEQLWKYCDLVNSGVDEDDLWFDDDGKIVTIEDVESRYNDAIANEYIEADDYVDAQEWAEDEGYKKYLS